MLDFLKPPFSLIAKVLTVPHTAQLEVASQELQDQILERQRAEAALQQSEARFHRMAANFPGGMIFQFLLRPDGSVAFPYISPSCREIYGAVADFRMHSGEQ